MSDQISPEITQQTTIPSLRSRYESVRPTVKRSVEKAFANGRSRKQISAVREGAFHTAEELHEEAFVDTLTGLNRRKLFQEATEREMASVTRDRTGTKGVSMSFIDLDNYGRFNKDLGEAAGDTTLTLVGETIKKTIRKTDIAGRWGGEEMAVTQVYENNPTASSVDASERIRQSIKNMDIPLRDGAITEHVTASIGVTEHVPGETFAEFRERAGIAMKLAKFFGKDRSVHATQRQDGKLDVMDYKTGESYIYESEIINSPANSDNKQLNEYLFDLKEQTKIQIERDPNGKGYKRKIIDVFDQENPMNITSSISTAQ